MNLVNEIHVLFLVFGTQGKNLEICTREGIKSGCFKAVLQEIYLMIDPTFSYNSKIC